MKILPPQKNNRRNSSSRSGLTLVEVMLTSGLLTMVIMTILSAHLIGLRLDQLIESKAGASDSSRRTLQQLPADIRSSKMWQIGSLNGTNFTPITNGAAQQGTALQLFLTTNGSQSVIYYFDLSDSANSDGKLMRTANSNWHPVPLASNLINSLYFTAENYNGTVQTNFGSSLAYKNVIHVTLQFCLFLYPITMVGSNYLYDFYQMDFKATPHLPE